MAKEVILTSSGHSSKMTVLHSSPQLPFFNDLSGSGNFELDIDLVL